MENQNFIYNGIECTIICEGLKEVNKFNICVDYTLYFSNKGDFWTFSKLYDKKGNFWKYDFNNKRFDSFNEMILFMYNEKYIY